MDVLRSLGVVKIVSAQENRVAHDIMAIHGIMPHGTIPN
jgi:hypothetical protein